MRKILIYGYGNPGRQDDALGVNFAEEMERWVREQGMDHIDVDTNYQLNIEDAETISHFDQVIFADASREEHITSFEITIVQPSEKEVFTMHAVSPTFILHLCSSIYGNTPDTYLIHIRGYEWELQEGLTSRASENLEKAIIYMKKTLVNNQ
jgi:hydrogenase maturation protease